MAAGGDITVYSGTIYDVVITNPAPVGANPGGETLVGFSLKIVNTTGNSGLDPASFNGNTPQESQPNDPTLWPYMPIYSGLTTTQPAFHNQYLAMDGTSATIDDPEFATDIDTHFNFLSSDVLFVGTPASETNLSPSPTAEPFNATGPWAAFAMTDFGDRLYGEFALIGGAIGPEWDLLYFAVPNNTTINMDFFVTAFDGDEVVIGSFTVPEPMTLSLLAAGGTVLLRSCRGEA